MPGAFPFFRDVLAWMTSLLVGGSVLALRSVVASYMFDKAVGGGLFKISLKCSGSVFLSLSDINRSPFLSFTSMLVIHRSLFIACGFFLFQECQIFYVLPLVRSCSKLHLSYLRTVHLLMLFFLQLGFQIHDFPFNFRLLSIAFMHQVTATPLASPACILQNSNHRGVGGHRVYVGIRHPFYTWVVQASNSLEIKRYRSRRFDCLGFIRQWGILITRYHLYRDGGL